MRGPTKVDGAKRLGWGKAARLTQVVGRPVPLPRKSLGCSPDTPWSVKMSNPMGEPLRYARAEAASWSSGALQRVRNEGLVQSTAGEGGPPPLSWAQVAELVKWTSGASLAREVEGFTNWTTEKGVPPLHERVRTASAARQTSGASESRVVEGPVKKDVGREVPPSQSRARVADTARPTSGASWRLEVAGPVWKAAEREVPPSQSKARVADTARQTSEAPQRVEVESHIKRAAEREVPPSRSWAQVASLAGRSSGASPGMEVEGRVKKATQVRPVGRTVETPLEDEGLAVVMKAIEKGVEPDERVMGEEAHAIWKLKEHLWLDQDGVLKTTGTTEAGRVLCPAVGGSSWC